VQNNKVTAEGCLRSCMAQWTGHLLFEFISKYR